MFLGGKEILVLLLLSKDDAMQALIVSILRHLTSHWSYMSLFASWISFLLSIVMPRLSIPSIRSTFNTSNKITRGRSWISCCLIMNSKSSCFLSLLLTLINRDFWQMECYDEVLL